MNKQMNELKLWSDKKIKTEKQTPLSEEETKIAENETSFSIRSYGNLNQDTLEASIIGHMVSDHRLDGDIVSRSKIEKIMGLGIKDCWFERRDFGCLFSDICQFYRKFRRVPSIDELGEICIEKGQTPTEACSYKHAVRACRGTVHAQRVGIDLLVQRLWSRYSQKSTDKFYQDYKKDCNNPQIGPVQASENLAKRMRVNTKPVEDSDVKVSDFIDNYESNMNWHRDLRENPEKYKGFMCGIRAIDGKVQGFRKGQLTIIVGAHGGFKTTLMMNISFGCYLNKCNVLYISLEMDTDIVETKLWCRASGAVSYSRVYNGGKTYPEDWDLIDKLESELAGTMSESERAIKSAKLFTLKNNLKGINRGDNKEDSVIIDGIKKQFELNPNKYKTMTASQSSKLKPSQIEAWLEEQAGIYSPDIVFIDYLGLMGADSPNPLRPDQDLGNICKFMRQMGRNRGFSVVAAAQLNRAAIKKVNDAGIDTPEKANLGTGDIAGSYEIGGDAENVFILWREPGGNSVRILTAKARYGTVDTEKGQTVQVDHETCTISDNIKDLTDKTGTVNTLNVGSAVHNIASGKTNFPKTDLSDDDIFANPDLEQPLDGDGSSFDANGKKTDAMNDIEI